MVRLMTDRSTETDRHSSLRTVRAGAQLLGEEDSTEAGDVFGRSLEKTETHGVRPIRKLAHDTGRSLGVAVCRLGLALFEKEID